MFLSAFVSHYQPDGTLSVDLRDQGGPIVGYGPFAAGMPWFRRRGGGWVETAYDWGARLVNPAHESRQDLPVLRYLEPWPRDFIRALHPVWYAQSAAMQVCARYPAARLLDARHESTGFAGTIGAETRLIADLGFESIDVVHLIVALEERFQRTDLPFENLLMKDGRYVSDLRVGEVAGFLSRHLAG